MLEASSAFVSTESLRIHIDQNEHMLNKAWWIMADDFYLIDSFSRPITKEFKMEL